jgi:recombination protein RecA
MGQLNFQGAREMKEPMQAEKHPLVEPILAALDAQFGRGAVVAPELRGPLPALSSGTAGLDLALGIGGYPRGRITEIYGPESSGKTTLALAAVAEAQREGLAAFIDAEHALDLAYAKKLGVDVASLLVGRPDCGEQALEIADAMVRSGAVALVAIDSVAALAPRAELDAEVGAPHAGLQARLMSHALRKLTASLSRSEAAVIFVNQLRRRPDVLFGSPEITPGGSALPFYASVRVEVRRVGTIKEGGRVVGDRVRARVVKTKVARPYGEAELELRYEGGVGL